MSDMTNIARIEALLGSLSLEQLAAVGPSERARLAWLCRRAQRWAEAPPAVSEAPRASSGVLAQLRDGARYD